MADPVGRYVDWLVEKQTRVTDEDFEVIDNAFRALTRLAVEDHDFEPMMALLNLKNRLRPR